MRQRLLLYGMRSYLVAHMNNPGFFDAKSRRKSNSIIYGLVTWMLSMPQAIDYEIFHAFEIFPFAVGH